MAECPECHGSGRIVLLISSRPCTRCGGRGWIEPAAKAPEPEIECESYSYDAATGAVVQVSSRTYDAQGRLVRETQTGGHEMKTYVLSDADPDIDDGPTDDEPDVD
jgi:RecJ-like exonuclease